MTRRTSAEDAFPFNATLFDRIRDEEEITRWFILIWCLSFRMEAADGKTWWIERRTIYFDWDVWKMEKWNLWERWDDRVRLPRMTPNSWMELLGVNEDDWSSSKMTRRDLRRIFKSLAEPRRILTHLHSSNMTSFQAGWPHLGFRKVNEKERSLLKFLLENDPTLN